MASKISKANRLEAEQRASDLRHTAEAFTGADYDLVCGQYAAWCRGQIVGWADKANEAYRLATARHAATLGQAA